MHWGNVAKAAAVLAAMGLLYVLKVPVPPALVAMAGWAVQALLPSVVKGWAP